MAIDYSSLEALEASLAKSGTGELVIELEEKFGNSLKVTATEAGINISKKVDNADIGCARIYKVYKGNRWGLTDTMRGVEWSEEQISARRKNLSVEEWYDHLISQDKNGDNALHLLAKTSEPTIIRMALKGLSAEQLTDALMMKNNKGMMPLHEISILNRFTHPSIIPELLLAPLLFVVFAGPTKKIIDAAFGIDSMVIGEICKSFSEAKGGRKAFKGMLKTIQKSDNKLYKTLSGLLIKAGRRDTKIFPMLIA